MTVNNTVPPTISGTAKQGQRYTANPGTWTHDDDEIRYEYQWERCDAVGASCVDIASAVDPTYLLAAADVGHTHRVRVHGIEYDVTPPPDFPAPPGGSLYVAASGGSDSSPGTEGAPFATIAKLYNSLSPGQWGVLRGGNHGSFGTYPGEYTRGGTSDGNRFTITNYPGEKATIRGYFASRGPFVTLRNLYFDCSNSFHAANPCAVQALGLIIAGNDTILEYCDVTQSQAQKGSGILSGSSTNGTGHRIIYRYNRIHGIGQCQNLDHGIYLGYGNDVQIYGNWLWTNSHGWAFQIYPEALRALVHDNVADGFGGGAVISDNGSATCRDNDVYHNVFINMIHMVNTLTGFSTNGAGISGSGAVPGTNNKFRDNDVYNCPDGVGSANNIANFGNTTVNPLFEDAAAHDYRPSISSPAEILAYDLPDFLVGPNV